MGFVNRKRTLKQQSVKDEDSYVSNAKESLISSLQLPKDLMLGAVILTITGQHEAYVENYRGIIEYTNQVIKLQTKTCRVCISGKRLAIDYFTNDEMKVTGEILEIKYY